MFLSNKIISTSFTLVVFHLNEFLYCWYFTETVETVLSFYFYSPQLKPWAVVKTEGNENKMRLVECIYPFPSIDRSLY